MKKLGLFCVLASLMPASYAHDFWLEPGHFYYESAASVPIQFKVGHGDEADHWNLMWEKIVAIRNYTSHGVTDMAVSVIPRSNMLPGMAKTKKLKEGSYVIGFESYHSLSSLEADKFNRYVEDEGLKEIQAYRHSNGLMETTGTELYSRKAKTIVQVGSELSDVVTAPIGHTLEIIPLRHPASLGKGEALPVQVLFRGEPLEDALIDLSPLANAGHEAKSLETGVDGKATFNFSGEGPLMLSVVWGVPTQNSRDATFETYFSSLTFTVNQEK